MLIFHRILVSAIVLGAGAVSLSACGQRGDLYLPTEHNAHNRATLPETLIPFRTKTASQPAPQTDPSPTPTPIPSVTTAPQ